tara:strand:+ start:1157 stop:2038 length:882 start_codon:yes stop_codon:yes gene_type:complete
MSFKIFSNFRSENHPTYDGIKEICKNKPITFFYDYIPKNIEQLQINPFNFIMIHEPNEFFGMHKWVLENHELFSGILTWNADILEKCDNAILFHHCGDGLAGELSNKSLDDFNKKYYKKDFEISFLSGIKNLVEGHQLRQEIYKIKDQIKMPKKWFHTLEDFDQEDYNKGGVGRPDSIWGAKQICFQTPMFHVAVENVNSPNWYTEKIADAFATKTVPIFWGCPNIKELGYDDRGIIKFTNIDELIKIINSLTTETYYKKQQYMEHNYQNVKLDRVKDKLELFFTQIITLNNL